MPKLFCGKCGAILRWGNAHVLAEGFGKMPIIPETAKTGNLLQALFTTENVFLG